MTLNEIKDKLKSKSVTRVVNEYIFHNSPVWLRNHEELIWEIKDKLSIYFNIHKKNIEIVGSAKLGISLSEERFGEKFNKGSDIDFLLVSDELFNIAWDELLGLEANWYKLTDREREFLKESYETIHRGFISPDRFPKIPFREKWWEIFTELSNKEKYEYRKIRGRLFKNWWFAEKYYSIQIKKISKN